MLQLICCLFVKLYRSNSVIRCFAWHPHAPKFAVALHDDSICIHQAHPSDIVPMLKHKMQLSVADIAWKYDVSAFHSLSFFIASVLLVRHRFWGDSAKSTVNNILELVVVVV